VRTAIEIVEAIRARRTSAVAVMEECLAEIAAKNERVNAFVFVDEALALERAAAVDRALEDGRDAGTLAGVPFGIKDLRDRCEGMPTTKGSFFFRDAPPSERDSVHVARLRAAGAVPVGMVASAEFGMDGVTHTLAFGTTRNPWNLERTPSGSSGGSAAAVAAGMVPLATGSDAGGSIRCPAHYCGLVGLKPSHGRIARDDGASDRATLGALTTTVPDTARYLDVVAGPHVLDRMSLPAPTIRYESAIETLDVAGLRAAWSLDLGYAPVEPEVAALVEAAARRLVRAAGLELVPRRVELVNTYMSSNLMMTAVFARELELDGILPDRIDEISPGPRFFLDRMRRATPRDHQLAQRREHQLEAQLADLFDDVDVLLTPTSGCVAFAAEGPLPELIAERDASETHGDPFTMAANIGWMPSISVPAGITREGLPVGLLITGARHRDEVVLRLARILERESPWPRHPPGW
jgi:aspartyl-tRNA(Asn)/glutamyl-tRNA(Gln) amidotransferase subunit A